MNYCNSYGKCTQGHGCPARQVCELPLDQDKPVRRSWIAVNVLLFAFLLGSAGYLLDRHDEQREADHTPEQRELRKELAAAKLCRTEHGESLVSWSAAGELVCIPRGYIHRKNQIAIR
jgi:hypothetical protein